MTIDPLRRRLVTLLLAAITLLVARVVAHRFDAPATVERGLYLAALGCLLAGILVLVDERL